MAQGCHLIYSHSDREHFPLNQKIERPTVDKVAKQFIAAFNLPWDYIFSQGLVENAASGICINEGAISAHGITKEILDTFMDRYHVLDTRYQAFLSGLLSAKGGCQADIIKGFGNLSLMGDMVRELPKALDHILKHDNDITGLFNRARAGASSWVSNLKNSGLGKADGIAYEVLATEKILETKPRWLPVSVGDNLDFGRKIQASYGSGGDLKVSNGFKTEIFTQPHRGTVEADLLISKSLWDLWDGGKEIAVDFKHSVGRASIQTEQLEGVAVALKTREVDEWHFISNVQFSDPVKEQVSKINEDLKTSKSPTIQLHENFDWR